MAIDAVTASAEARRFRSPQAALSYGVGAARGGNISEAIPALEEAAAAGLLEGQYFLAEIYADNRGNFTDHRKSFSLFQRIVEEHAGSVEADEKPESTYLAKSLVALAGYWLRGLPEMNVRPTPERAAYYLDMAANLFGDEDAQFELAKLYLVGEGVPKDLRLGLHYLSTLSSTNRHAGAQAFLADLYWRGKFVEKDQLRAFALIMTAVENASPADELWIDGIFATIYCGVPSDVRKQSDSYVAEFKRRYTPRVQPDRNGSASLTASRVCENGDPVPMLRKAPTVYTRPGVGMLPTGDGR
ncbi:MAG TPA: tetratricopeptide repeat protein [Hyphomicrobiaceae bacterium]|nr:tetratricopeptide repeat protein [Hyphomicrobiaceae bacterium]